jgi:DNA adenine methylase
MDNSAHIELSKALNSAKGLVAISNYECDLMNELYPSKKWTKVYGPKKIIHSTKDTRQEVLWINYDINKRNSKKSLSLFTYEQ